MAVRAVFSVVLAWAGADAAAGQEVTIGRLDGPDEYNFGLITDVGADSLGRMVVIDAQQSEPRAYTAEGEYLGMLGRAGQGPGEFLGPSDVGVSLGGRVAVVDNRNARVSLLRLTTNGPVFEQAFRPDRVLGGICWIRNRLFGLSVHGTTEPLLVEYDTEGRVVQEFGERLQASGGLEGIYGDEPPHTLNQGHLDCDEESESIAYASTVTGEVRLYSEAGQLQWATSVPGWIRIRIQRTRDGYCCQFGPPEDGHYNSLRGLVIDDDVILAASELVGIEGSEAHVFRRSDGAFLRLETGNPFYRERLPDGRWVGYRKVPFGHVVVGRD